MACFWVWLWGAPIAFTLVIAFVYSRDELARYRDTPLAAIAGAIFIALLWPIAALYVAGCVLGAAIQEREA